MKAISATVLALLAGVCILQAEAPEGWATNPLQALQTARAQGMPVLINFSASWCAPCKIMARTTFKDEAVAKQLDRFAKVVIDIDENRDLAQENRINSVPTFMLMSPDGDEVLRASGYMEAARFVRWLTNALAAYAVFQAEQRRFVSQQRVIGEALRGSDASARAGAVQTLFELCAHRDQSRQRFALAQLKSMAATDAAALLDGLNHPQLATRIHISNLLREKLGAEFAFDPWEPGPARARQIMEWKRRLTESRRPAGQRE